MNKDQVKGVAKNVAGQVQEKAGKLVGSKEQQIKGIDKQLSGKAEKNFGDAKEHIKAQSDILDLPTWRHLAATCGFFFANSKS